MDKQVKIRLILGKFNLLLTPVLFYYEQSPRRRRGIW